MSSEKYRDLVARRDDLLEKFDYYSRPAVINGNLEALANMALVLGRLDKMIRDEIAVNNKRSQVEHYKRMVQTAHDMAARGHIDRRSGPGTPPHQGSGGKKETALQKALRILGLGQGAV